MVRHTRSLRLTAAVLSLLAAPAAALAAPLTAPAFAGTGPASTGTGPASTGTGSVAPAVAGTASDAPVTATAFGYYMYPAAMVNGGLCTDPVTDLTKLSDVTDAPYYANADCGMSEVTLSGPATAVTARLYGEGATAPFTQLDAVAAPTGGDAWQVHLEPLPDWPAGRIRMQVLADGKPAGESWFGQNLLDATVTATGTFAPGQDIPVTGLVEERDSGPLAPADRGVPASFTLRATAPDGTVLHHERITAGDDGTFVATVPGSATSGLHPGKEQDFTTVLGLAVVDADYTDAATDPWRGSHAGSGSATVVAPPSGLSLRNSFVSSVGWVKPGDSYPSRLFVTNATDRAFSDVSVTVPAPDGATFTQARPGAGSGTASVSGGSVTWQVGTVPAATADGPSVATLVLESDAATLAEDPRLVWKDLSSTATLTVGGSVEDTATSHGPKVIPPAGGYDTARYGDRPFPVVPVDYLDRAHQGSHSGAGLADVINSPRVAGSTYNLYQEMSLGQLFPHGTVPSAGIASADFTGVSADTFSTLAPQGTCRGATLPQAAGTPLYPQRIKDGFYQLPGTTDYYGDDKYGSAVAGSVTGVGTLMDIDSACGPAGKLVYDAAAIADPEIDYSDYDTDKDGVVDFFMVVFAGCGGNGASQLGPLGCDYDPVTNDNVWPHSSSLEFYYTDPETGLPGFTTHDQLKNLEGVPMYYTDAHRTTMTTDVTPYKVFVRVGPYNVNPETAMDKASVISHEYGHSLGLPDFYSLGSRETYGDWNLMATDKSQNMDVFSRQELGWIVPQVLQPGATTVRGWKDSKQDTHSITWRTQDGTPYTLSGAGVHNSQAYVAKLPGRRLIDPAKFDSGDKASGTHAWWSGSGNDFGCPPDGGHNLDLAVPGLKDLPAGSTVTLTMKSLFDIEWDYDYGFVLTSTDNGKTYTSHASTRSVPTTTSTNANQNGCQALYGNGITGSSASYTDSQTVLLDKTTGNYPDATFVADSFDVSDLAGADSGVIRLAYATDPGLARPGWFVDDLRVTATTPSGTTVLLDTDLETDGGPDDPRVFNGGCTESLTVAQTCTKGWNYIDSSADSPADHAYYLEMRDRSGFDYDGHGQIDRDPIGWAPGLSVVYTDEAHGYGNVGTDNPPAQSPLDASPEPGSDTPDLNDAAFTPAAGHFSDAGEGHTDNYSDPAETSTDPSYSGVSNPWRFRYDCLTFDVLSMSGQDVAPAGNLTGDVAFDLGAGCGSFDYGYDDAAGATTPNTAPVAAFTATPRPGVAGSPVTLSAEGSRDAETPAAALDYSWDFGDGGSAKDAAGSVAHVTYPAAGTYPVTLTVTDGGGLSAVRRMDLVVDPAPAGSGSGGSGSSGSGASPATVRVACSAARVDRAGSWRTVRSSAARGGRYCDNLGRGAGRDVLRTSFTGGRLTVAFGRARAGGIAKVLVDGDRVGRIDFSSGTRRVRFGFQRTVTGLGAGRHTVRLVMVRGAGYVDDLTYRR